MSTDRHAVKFFYKAKGPAAELLTQAIIAHEIGSFTDEQFEPIETECRKISSMLSKVIRARSPKSDNNA